MKIVLLTIISLLLILACATDIKIASSAEILLWLRIDVLLYRHSELRISISGIGNVIVGNLTKGATYVTTLRLSKGISLYNITCKGSIIIARQNNMIKILHEGKCAVIFTGNGTVNVDIEVFTNVMNFYVPVIGNEATFSLDKIDFPENFDKILMVIGFEGATNKVISYVVHNGEILNITADPRLLGSLAVLELDKSSYMGRYVVRLVSSPVVLPSMYVVEMGNITWGYEGLVKGRVHVNLTSIISKYPTDKQFFGVYLEIFQVPHNATVRVIAPHALLSSVITKDIFVVRKTSMIVMSYDFYIDVVEPMYVKISAVPLSLTDNGILVTRYPENYIIGYIKASCLLLKPYVLMLNSTTRKYVAKSKQLLLHAADLSKRPLQTLDVSIQIRNAINDTIQREYLIHKLPILLNITPNDIIYVTALSNFTRVMDYIIMSPPSNITLRASLSELLLEIRDYEDKLVSNVTIYMSGPNQAGPVIINTLSLNGTLRVSCIPVGSYTISVLKDGIVLVRDVLNITRPGLYVVHVPLFSIKIQVFDRKGRRISGANVLVHNEHIYLKGITDEKGEISLDQVPPGTYYIQVIWMNKTVYGDFIEIVEGHTDIALTLNLFDLKIRVSSPLIKAFRGKKVFLISNSIEISTEVDEYGFALFKYIPPGSYLLRFNGIEKNVVVRDKDVLVEIRIPFIVILKEVIRSYWEFICITIGLIVVLILLFKIRSKGELIIE